MNNDSGERSIWVADGSGAGLVSLSVVIGDGDVGAEQPFADIQLALFDHLYFSGWVHRESAN